jgi:hypothetical protein
MPDTSTGLTRVPSRASTPSPSRVRRAISASAAPSSRICSARRSAATSANRPPPLASSRPCRRSWTSSSHWRCSSARARRTSSAGFAVGGGGRCALEAGEPGCCRVGGRKGLGATTPRLCRRAAKAGSNGECGSSASRACLPAAARDRQPSSLVEMPPIDVPGEECEAVGAGRC